MKKTQRTSASSRQNWFFGSNNLSILILKCSVFVYSINCFLWVWIFFQPWHWFLYTPLLISGYCSIIITHHEPWKHLTWQKFDYQKKKLKTENVIYFSLATTQKRVYSLQINLLYYDRHKASSDSLPAHPCTLMKYISHKAVMCEGGWNCAKRAYLIFKAKKIW